MKPIYHLRDIYEAIRAPEESVRLLERSIALLHETENGRFIEKIDGELKIATGELSDGRFGISSVTGRATYDGDASSGKLNQRDSNAPDLSFYLSQEATEAVIRQAAMRKVAQLHEQISVLNTMDAAPGRAADVTKGFYLENPKSVIEKSLPLGTELVSFNTHGPKEQTDVSLCGPMHQWTDELIAENSRKHGVTVVSTRVTLSGHLAAALVESRNGERRWIQYSAIQSFGSNGWMTPDDARSLSRKARSERATELQKQKEDAEVELTKLGI